MKTFKQFIKEENELPEGKIVDKISKGLDIAADKLDKLGDYVVKLRQTIADKQDAAVMKVVNHFKPKFNPGDKVQIYPNSPLFKDVKLIGTVIDKSKITLNDKGIPTNTASDEYLPPDWEREVPVLIDGKEIMIVPKSLLKKG
jgi:hypothetical protein